MIEKQPHGLDRVELKKWRSEQLRGRCHEKSAAEQALAKAKGEDQ